MKIVTNTNIELEQGDRVRLDEGIRKYYKENMKNFNVEEGEILIVELHDGNEVYTNKGIFDFSDLELI